MMGDAIFRPQTWSERWLSLRLGLIIPGVELWMRKTSFKACSRGLSRLAHWLPPYRSRLHSLSEAQRIAELVAYANQRYSLYPADCLTRSLVLQYLIIRLGGEAALCLGVRRFTGQFEAHAWVEYEDHPLGEPEPVNDIYTRFDWTRHSLEGESG